MTPVSDHDPEVEQDPWKNEFKTLEECQGLCEGGSLNVTASGAAVDENMPDSQHPQAWQCTDTPALESWIRKRSCLAYDNSNGYTFDQGECVPSGRKSKLERYSRTSK